MFAKSLIAAAAVAVSVAGFSATQANAGVDVDVTIGGGFYPGHYGGYPVYPVYEEPVYHSWGVSCFEGKQIVRSAGFRKVQPKDCSGRRFSYFARKHGDSFIVRVSRKTGNIISVSEVYH